MSLYPPDIIEQVKDRVDLVNLVSERVSLKKSGQSFRGLCPFHTEKTPSFYVHPAKSIFHCFGCGEGGDAIKFVMKTEGMSFVEAVQDLARRVGMSLPEVKTDSRETRFRDRMLAALAEADRYYRSQLAGPEGEAARRYLAGRGVDSKTGSRFGLGWAPSGRDRLLRHLAGKGFELQVLEKAGLVLSDRGKFRDRFWERLLFPIQSSSGKVIGFGGRALADQEPKYLNSPETPVYHKGRLLYPLPLARAASVRRDRALIVEGYFDVITAHRLGFEETFAPLGTALTGDQADVIRRLVSTVYLIFDADNAGRRAALRALEIILPREMIAKVVLLPAGEDPDSFLRAQGSEAFEGLLTQAQDLVEFAIDGILQECSVDDLAGRMKAVKAFNQFSAMMPSRLQRDYYLGRFLEKTGLEEAVVRSELSRAKPAPRMNSPWEVKEKSSIDALEEEVVRLIIKGWESIRPAVSTIDLKVLKDPVVRKIVARLQSVNNGDSSVGKDPKPPLLELQDDFVDSLVSSLDMEDSIEDVDSRWENAITRLKERWLKEELRRISHRITKAEKANQIEEVSALLKVKQRLLTEHC